MERAALTATVDASAHATRHAKPSRAAEPALSASARLRRMADKIEVVERVKDLLERVQPAMPATDAETMDRSVLIECETLLRFLSGERITGAEYEALRDGEATNFMGGYHLEPLAETYPGDAVVEWQFEEVIVDHLLRCAAHVLLTSVMTDRVVNAPEFAKDLARLRRLLARIAPKACSG